MDTSGAHPPEKSGKHSQKPIVRRSKEECCGSSASAAESTAEAESEAANVGAPPTAASQDPNEPGVSVGMLKADRIAQGAQYIMKTRRVVKGLQASVDTAAQVAAEAVGSQSSKANAFRSRAIAGFDQRIIGGAISELDQRLRLSEKVAAADARLGFTETAAAVDKRLGLSETAAAVDQKYRLSERASALKQELDENVAEVSEHASKLISQGAGHKAKLWNDLNKTVMRTAAASLGPMRQLMTALDPLALSFYDAQSFPGVAGCVALTIDDAPCHVPNIEKSMLREVGALLEEFGATATFFLCADYVAGHEEDLIALIKDGHEVANHCGADRSYSADAEERFEAAFLKSERICDELRRDAGAATNLLEQQQQLPSPTSPKSNMLDKQGGADIAFSVGAHPSPSSSSSAAPPEERRTSVFGPGAADAGQSCGFAPPPRVLGSQKLEPEEACWPSNKAPELAEISLSKKYRWFRAPHADASPQMQRVLQKYGFTNVLCDAFANDTVITDSEFIAKTLLKQVDAAGGSIVVVHTPERGFREHNLHALRLFLQGLKELELKAVTVSALAEAAWSPRIPSK